ncbi:hypothetical protein A4R43_15100 [Amycolatopsis albispora]|uniref:DUF2637 domain-containing protein n=1 Tax=Amycolatopsis albispora TaxID=1804986 RepID=A0A344LKD7_9PSEU|nr:hypothetical protein A4R43_15100 [Amycolatopsis albispora]
MIMGTVVGLTFLFGFGNVLNLALRLGVPVWVAPLVAPAVDLSILGLLLGIRHLVLAGATAAQLQPARRLLMFASVVTLALNVAEPLVAGQYGKAAFDAVGPLLLIGWAEVGPGLIQAMAGTCREPAPVRPVGGPNPRVSEAQETDGLPGADSVKDDQGDPGERPAAHLKNRGLDHGLLERARREDALHWEQHKRPISAETLRKRLGVGAVRSRELVAAVRSAQVVKP